MTPKMGGGVDVHTLSIASSPKAIAFLHRQIADG